MRFPTILCHRYHPLIGFLEVYLAVDSNSPLTTLTLLFASPEEGTLGSCSTGLVRSIGEARSASRARSLRADVFPEINCCMGNYEI